MKKQIIVAIAVAMTAGLAQAGLVDGGFTTITDPGDNWSQFKDVDTGWLTRGGDWIVSGGAAVTDSGGPSALGQVFTNTQTGFGTFSFDYNDNGTSGTVKYFVFGYYNTPTTDPLADGFILTGAFNAVQFGGDKTDIAWNKDASNGTTTTAAFDITSYEYIGVRFIQQDTTAGQTISNVSFSQIPEPATLGLVAAFGGGILFIRRKLMI